MLLLGGVQSEAYVEFNKKKNEQSTQKKFELGTGGRNTWET